MKALQEAMTLTEQGGCFRRLLRMIPPAIPFDAFLLETIELSQYFGV